jgi:hypothetical protein
MLVGLQGRQELNVAMLSVVPIPFLREISFSRGYNGVWIEWGKKN